MSAPAPRVVVVRASPTVVVVRSPGPPGPSGATGPPGETYLVLAPDGRVVLDGGPPTISSGA